MGFFGREFVDVRAELGGGDPDSDLAIGWEDLSRWERQNPNGVTLYFREGRYLLRRWRESYLFWDGDYVFPAGSTLWFERGATLVYEGARVVVRGQIHAPLWQIFRREHGIDQTIGRADPLSRGHVLIDSDLPSVHPEWWGAASSPTGTDDLALREAIESATSLRAPLASTLILNRETGRYELRRREGRRRPPIPVVFSQRYRVTAPVMVGTPVHLSNEQLLGIQPNIEVLLEFGVPGRVTAVLRGLNHGTNTPSGGLIYIGPESADANLAVLHLKNCFGATVDDISVDANGRVDLGILLEPTNDVPQMHSVAIRRCRVRNARSAQIQVGPAVQASALRIPVTVSDSRELGGPGQGNVITIEAPLTYVDPNPPPEFRNRVWGSDNGLDTPGLVIDGCLIECQIQRVPYAYRAGAPVGIQLRAQNGVANLITNCRFQGEATAFVDARATIALIENCDFENGYYTEPASGRPYLDQVSINGQQVPAYLESTSGSGNLGFEEPSGHDVYLSADPIRVDPRVGGLIDALIRDGNTDWTLTPIFFEPSKVEGNVAMHGCTSRSAMLFGTVRPGPIEGKRSERATMILGCVHQPRWLHPPPVSSVQWGRAGVSPYRATPVGMSPGYSGDPCFCVVGSYLEAGVEVFQGAAQCAAVAFNTRQERVARPVAVSRARPGVMAQTYIFGLVLAVLAMMTAGCGQSASGVATDAGVTIDASQPSADGAAADISTTRPDDHAAPPEDVNLFPFEIPGTVPFDNYPPPRQYRRNCPVREDGDPTIPPPRLVSPLSNLRVTSQRPTLSWELPVGLTGAQIELCRDPCCTAVFLTVNAEGTSVRPTTALTAGVVFWRARGMVGSRVGRDTSFTWELGVPHRDSSIDTFKGPIHDFNGDGYDDVAAEVYPGVRVYWGGKGGLAERRFSDYRLDYPGQSVVNLNLEVADLNADGFADILISGQGHQVVHNYSTVRVLHGGADGMTDSGVAQIVGNVTSLTDLNGDGYVDLVGRAPSGFLGTSRGRAMILFGGAVWSGYGRAFIDDPSRAEATQLFGGCEAPGDFDGDGFGDMFVSDIQYDRGRGRLYYYRGRANGLIRMPERAFDPPPQIQFIAEWGSAYGIGDIDGNRLADIMVLSQDIQQVLMFGGRDVDDVASFVIRSTYPTSVVGSSTGPATDFNGDGLQDIYLGCSVCLDRNSPLVSAGRIVVMTDAALGAPRLLLEVEPPRGDDHQGGRFFGRPILAIDVDGDGFDDLVTRDPEQVHLPEFPARGYLFVLFGGTTFGDRWQRVYGVDLYDTHEGSGIVEIASRSEELSRGTDAWEPSV